MTALTTKDGPAVSVIVPARNEEACLGACLDSLLAQTGVDFEIIVVDDHSTEGTRTIAASRSGMRVIEAGPLGEGCSGKCNAAQSGADVAGGEWLLFTDADTVHLAGSLERSLREAREHQVALLSYSPAQEVHGAARHPPKKEKNRNIPTAVVQSNFFRGRFPTSRRRFQGCARDSAGSSTEKESVDSPNLPTQVAQQDSRC